MKERLPPRHLRIDEHPRLRLARQLHEGVCQMLFAARTKIVLLRSLDGDACRDGLLDELQAIVDETMEQSRSLACELNAGLPAEPSQPPLPDGLAATRDSADRRHTALGERHEAGSLPAVSHPEPVANRSHSLSDRELEVLQLLARGLGTRQISQTLQIGAGTISGYRRSIIQKLGLRGVARLTKYAVAAGLAPLTE